MVGLEKNDTMKTTLQFIILLFVCNPLFSQENSNSFLQTKLDSTRYSKGIYCDSLANTDIDIKICLYLEFLHLDSILSSKFNNYLLTISTDSSRTKLIDFQKQWENNRSLQGQVGAEDYEGHQFGIHYLYSVIYSTILRTKEIEYLTTKE